MTVISELGIFHCYLRGQKTHKNVRTVKRGQRYKVKEAQAQVYHRRITEDFVKNFDGGVKNEKSKVLLDKKIPVINLIGKTNLLEFISIIEKANFVWYNNKKGT